VNRPPRRGPLSLLAALVISGACAPAARPPAPSPEPPAAVVRDTAPVQRDTLAQPRRDTVPPRADTVPAARADSVLRDPEARRFRVCATGDVTLGTNLDTAWAKLGARRLRSSWGLSDDPFELVARVRPLFADADLVLVNVETAIGTGPSRTKCGRRSTNCYAFRAPVSAADAIRSLADSAAVVVGNVANNHARDAGDDGVDSTMAHLSRAGVLATGRDTLATPVRIADSLVIGVLGFYAGDMVNDARNVAAVRRHVRRAAETYRTVIVTAHIGAEGIGWQRTRDTTEIFLQSRIDRGNPVAFARAAFESGAALVVAHGPHVLRAAEWFGEDRLVFYSLGNLLTYGPFNNEEPLNRGAVACVDLARGRVVAAELRPTVQRAPGVVEPDPARRALRLIDSLSVLDFPATAGRVDRETGALIPRRRSDPPR
jgi:poly-gamma-glutamate capsule biosynthesis protein CapA/YwtB (metallophosphatase superfamily)